MAAFETMARSRGTTHIGPSLRNRVPILLALHERLRFSGGGFGVDLSAGTGAHLEVLAPAFETLTWVGTEFVEAQLPIIDAVGHAVHNNIEKAVRVDLSQGVDGIAALQDKVGQSQLVFCANVCHITPWQVSTGMFDVAAKLLQAGGSFALYGPFKQNGEFTGNNEAFDASLRARDESWGVRNLEDIQKEGHRVGLNLQEVVNMPANNLLLLFSKI